MTVNFIDSGQLLGNYDSQQEVALGDIDGDGDLDVVVPNYNSQPDRVYLNDGSGVFTLAQQLGNFRSIGAALGDVDGDGNLDVFISTELAPDYVYLNNGSGTFIDSGQSLVPNGITNPGYSDSGREVELADLDGDNDLDAYVVYSKRDFRHNVVWFNNGSGNFTDSGQQLGSYDGQDAALGDLDGDGDIDAFVANEARQINRVWLNDGNGFFNQTWSSPDALNSRSVELGDLDGDGDLDAVVGNDSTFGSPTYNQVWLNDGFGNFNEHQQLVTSDTFRVALEDVDNDGDLDAFFGSNLNLPNEVWLNDGSGTFTDSGQRLGNSWTHGAALGDLDGDGDLDAFVSNHFGQPNRVWLNQTEMPCPEGITWYGGNGHDYKEGTEGSDELSGGNGNDILHGLGCNDTLSGGNGTDELYGGLGDDELTGGNGPDFLYGGLGDDELTGGNGPDTFVLATGEGTDTITDFGDGPDVIGLAGELTFGDGVSDGDLSFSGNNIIVTSTSEILATLTGVDTTTLSAADFVIV